MSGQREAGEDTAALGFMAFLALVFGGAGILIAALAVGTERAWSGRQGGPGSGGWRQSAADHRDWLNLDRQRRVEAQRARQQWWRSGADPATRPSGPPWATRVGWGLRRFWARMFVSADRVHGAGQRFGAGFRAGFAVAQQARRDGANPWQVARARPVDAPEPQEAVPSVEEPVLEPATEPPTGAQPPAAAPTSEPEVQPEPARKPEPQAKPEPPAEGQPGIADFRRRLDEAFPSLPDPDSDPDVQWARRTRAEMPRTVASWFGRCPRVLPNNEPCGNNLCNESGHNHPPNNTYCCEHTQSSGGTAMTAPTTTTAPTGETNLDLTDADLAAIHQHLAAIQDLNDQLAGRRAALEGAVAAANERAATKGATAATQQALDEANAVVGVLGQHVSGVADATTAASDQTSAAQAGLAPARDAQDTLHSAGATGEFVAPATSD